MEVALPEGQEGWWEKNPSKNKIENESWREEDGPHMSRRNIAEGTRGRGVSRRKIRVGIEKEGEEIASVI